MIITNGDVRPPSRPKKLSELNIGDTFYYDHQTFEEAVQEADIWMVIKTQPSDTDKVSCVRMDGSVLLKRDGDHRVQRCLSSLRVCLPAEPFSQGN